MGKNAAHNNPIVRRGQDILRYLKALDSGDYHTLVALYQKAERDPQLDQAMMTTRKVWLKAESHAQS